MKKTLDKQCKPCYNYETNAIQQIFVKKYADKHKVVDYFQI